MRRVDLRLKLLKSLKNLEFLKKSSKFHFISRKIDHDLAFGLKINNS